MHLILRLILKIKELFPHTQSVNLTGPVLFHINFLIFALPFSLFKAQVLLTSYIYIYSINKAKITSVNNLICTNRSSLSKL